MLCLIWKDIFTIVGYIVKISQSLIFLNFNLYWLMWKYRVLVVNNYFKMVILLESLRNFRSLTDNINKNVDKVEPWNSTTED